MIDKNWFFFDDFMRWIVMITFINFVLVIDPSFGNEKYLDLPSEKNLDTTVKQLLKKFRFEEKEIGFVLLDLESNKVISSYNNHKFFVPGSVAKIFTALYALENLGPYYRFYTKLGYTGAVHDGILEGDLYLIGEGDPLLKSGNLMNMALTLHKHRIKKIKGHFYYIDSYFYRGSQISQLVHKDKVYNPGISALSLNFNRLKIWKSGSRRTSRARFEIIPQLENYQVKKIKSYFTPGVKFNQYMEKNRMIFNVSKRFRYRRVESIPTQYPSKYTADTLRFLAKGYGVILPEAKRGSFPSGNIKMIKKNPSKPLKDIINLNLEYSNNLLAELIGMAALKKERGETAGSIEEAGELMVDWFKKRFTHEDWSMSILTGSGLGPLNQITPYLVTRVLKYAFHKNYGGHYFISLLSISGESGSLKNRMNDPEMAYKVWGKTGSLDYVNSLAGYVFTKSGKKMAFSLFVNNFENREMLNVIEDTKKTQKVRSRGNYWRRRAVRLQDNIMRYWYRNY